MSAKISLLDAAFSYGEREIFSHLNLEVGKGDIFCILGPNGCGKTTLLRCLRGILHLTAGQARFGSKNISSMGPVETAKLMSFVTQEQVITFSYPVIETVLVGRAPHIGSFRSPTKKDIELAEEALKLVGMYHLRDRPYTQISGGERQLALIARALAQEPEVILLDEPTSHLDFGNQIRILKIIKKLAEDGLSIIMSSHFPDHAFLSSNKVAIMKEGAFMDVGSPDDVITEENMRHAYDVNVKIVHVGDGVDRKVCVPIKL